MPDAIQDVPLASWHLNVLSEPTPREKSFPLGTVTVVPVHFAPDHCVGPDPVWLMFPATFRFPLSVTSLENVFAPLTVSAPTRWTTAESAAAPVTCATE
jgi:hypothetical protein